MSMMWPPQSVKIVSTPSFFSALATRWPPETTSASRLLRLSVSSAVVVPLFSAVFGAVSSIPASILELISATAAPWVAAAHRRIARRGDSGAHSALLRTSEPEERVLQVSACCQLRRRVDAARAEATGVRAAHRLQNKERHEPRDDG